MTLDIILNELSQQTLAPSILVARQWMFSFIQTIISIKSQTGIQASLRTQYDFYAALLALDYPLQRWLNDNEVDREERRFIKTIATKSPFSQDIVNPEVQEIENNHATCEFRYQGKIAIGLGIAFTLDTIAISLLSDNCWDCSHLNVDIISIDEDEERIAIVRHTSRREHLQDHIEWIEQTVSIQGNLIDGVVLWDRQYELFPNLQFCDSVKKQLESLRIGDQMLKPIIKRLFDLQKYAASWTRGGFDSDQMNCKATPESEATLQKYSQERTFLCPDGQKRVFSWHVRLTPLAWRIHFHPKQQGQIIIGYIGYHLPTAKFN
jgi:hypothetical protein